MYNDLDKRIKALGLGRFQVMALLQAARYYLLNKDLNSAKSFGLNRAVFYAWAKYYGSRERYRFHRIDEELVRRITSGVKPDKSPEDYVEVLGECVKESQRGFFEIGGVEQTPYDYDQQVVLKINRLIDYRIVWEKTLEYLSKFPEQVLKDPAKFYKYVYEPVRDIFFNKLVTDGKVESPKYIVEKINTFEKMLEKETKQQKTLVNFINTEEKK